MSQNNTIKKSDKKFIRTQKAHIRATVLDLKKQQEMIDKLYEKFLAKPEVKEVRETKKEIEEPKKAEAKKEVKKPAVKKEAKIAKTKKS